MLYNWISLLLSWVEKIMIDLNGIVKCIEAVYYRYETRLQWIWLLTWILKDIWTNIQQCIPQFERCSHANQQDIRKCKHKSPREENKHCKTAQLNKNKHAGNKEVKFKSHRKKKNTGQTKTKVPCGTYINIENIQNTTKDTDTLENYFTFILQKAEEYIMNLDTCTSYTKKKTHFMNALFPRNHQFKYSWMVYMQTQNKYF